MHFAVLSSTAIAYLLAFFCKVAAAVGDRGCHEYNATANARLGKASELVKADEMNPYYWTEAKTEASPSGYQPSVLFTVAVDSSGAAANRTMALANKGDAKAKDIIFYIIFGPEIKSFQLRSGATCIQPTPVSVLSDYRHLTYLDSADRIVITPLL
jgi:hypothetical protein